VTIVIKTASTRPIDIVAKRQGKGCVATAFTAIAGKRAELKSIFLQLSGPLSVSSVAIKGVDLESGQPVVERVVQ
jgi:hypothetical protein